MNVSSVQDFYQCPFRWVMKWVENRVPKFEGPALAEGKLLHLIFEDHLKGVLTMEEACEVRCREWLRLARETNEPGLMTIAQKAVTGIKDRQEALAQWTDRYEWQIPALEVEEPFEIAFDEMPGVIFRGRPDRVGVMDNEVWHIQNRGLAGSMNFGVYMELATRHYHEHLYAEQNARKYPQYKVGGTLFNLVRKLKYRTNVGKKNEAVKTLDQMFFQHPMTINLKSRLHTHVMQSMFAHVERMQEVEARYRENGTIPPPNEKMNGGFVGNSIDPYFRILTGTASIYDNTLFKDREDTYAPADDTGIEVG